MGAKKLLPAYQIITNGVMTGTTTVESTPTNVANIDNLGMQISWTGSAVGTFTVQCSVDGNTYFALTFTPAITQPAGTSGGYLINLNQLPFQFVKASYTNASSTGTLNVWLIGKDVN